MNECPLLARAGMWVRSTPKQDAGCETQEEEDSVVEHDLESWNAETSKPAQAPESPEAKVALEEKRQLEAECRRCSNLNFDFRRGCGSSIKEAARMQGKCARLKPSGRRHRRLLEAPSGHQSRCLNHRKQVGEKTPFSTSASIQVAEIATGPGTYVACVRGTFEYFPVDNDDAVRDDFESGKLVHLNVYAEDKDIEFKDLDTPCKVEPVMDTSRIDSGEVTVNNDAGPTYVTIDGRGICHTPLNAESWTSVEKMVEAADADDEDFSTNEYSKEDTIAGFYGDRKMFYNPISMSDGYAGGYYEETNNEIGVPETWKNVGDIFAVQP